MSSKPTVTRIISIYLLEMGVFKNFSLNQGFKSFPTLLGEFGNSLKLWKNNSIHKTKKLWATIPALCLYVIPECVNEQISMSCAFSWALSLLFVCLFVLSTAHVSVSLLSYFAIVP